MSDPKEWADLQRSAADVLADAADEFEWQSAQLLFRSVGSTAEAVADVSLVNGEKVDIEAPIEAVIIMNKLRKAMASPEHGAWYTATLDLLRQEDLTVKMNVHYEYDEKPAFDIQPAADAYLEDLNRYPRPATEIPGWLQALLG